ncbi:MAG: HD domain-containing protein [Treponema sp.]|jgi:poly(A) polymerase|nr:HD domain-containing protein [Treponema sp.]
MDHTAIFGPLAAAGYAVSLRSFSALDRYLGLSSLPFVLAETNAGVAVLARHLEGLRFPGADIADAAADSGDQTWYFRCVDPDDAEQYRPSFDLLSLAQNWSIRRFQDPQNVYPLIRKLRDRGKRPIPYSGNRETPPPEQPWWAGVNAAAGRYEALMDAAVILARYVDREDDGQDLLPRPAELLRFLDALAPGLPPKPEAQRFLLGSLLVSARPDRGLELLKAAGFIREFWPELARLDGVDHSKEFHPEGNVWTHTLETFRYRKPTGHNRGAYDFRLSLGLLLHDSGKPLSASSGSNRFDGHAELGARVARKFLTRLGYEAPLIEDICYLARNHMLPAALPRLLRLRLAKTQEILESPLFPTLLELYRCDESSSFKGLDGYYESSAAYQMYLRNRRNPYRFADGTKIGRQHARGGSHGGG